MIEAYQVNSKIRATTYQQATTNTSTRYIKERVYIKKLNKRNIKNVLVLLSELKKLESGWDQTTTRYLSKLHRRKGAEESEERLRRRRRNLFFRGRR